MNNNMNDNNMPNATRIRAELDAVMNRFDIQAVGLFANDVATMNRYQQAFRREVYQSMFNIENKIRMAVEEFETYTNNPVLMARKTMMDLDAKINTLRLLNNKTTTTNAQKAINNERIAELRPMYEQARQAVYVADQVLLGNQNQQGAGVAGGLGDIPMNFEG
jgi:hypothetical protein